MTRGNPKLHDPGWQSPDGIGLVSSNAIARNKHLLVSHDALAIAALPHALEPKTIRVRHPAVGDQDEWGGLI
jgi:hypothetical protein